ncbi:hypothetical protein KFL_000840250 [Klebsormidium nitens]|uniref:Uncharacterized protein n=1 Tax=Klebsormidium nitens TaxID=105231 RepID=A0A1Y1HTX7_KLENI|nr:hypothetical protein KFL_000840250 [Klebsormidium nitens]|eukprot:GAQ81583.1 hypothetical protein KFL_000840250 [Klebsormidium nitens]
MSNGLETSFRFNNQDNGLVIHAKENFVNNNWGALLLVDGALDTKEGTIRAKITGKKKFFPDRPFLTSGEVGATLETDTKQVTYYAAGKKTFDLWNGGLTSLDLKASAFYHVNTEKEGLIKKKAKVELCQKIFNFTEEQDLKLKLGYDLLEKTPYASLRENRWILHSNLKDKWTVEYEL